MLQTIVETLPGFPLLCFQLPNHGTLQDIYNQTRQRCAALSDKEFSFLLNGRKVENDTCLLSKDGFPLLLKLHVPLLGGKGGFGEVLKAQGQKMSAKKSTNVDDCRDLNGKRIREQREQEEVLEYLKQEPERKRELEERKRKKLEKHLKEPVETKQRVELDGFEKEHEESLELISKAVRETQKKKQKRSKIL